MLEVDPLIVAPIPKPPGSTGPRRKRKRTGLKYEDFRWGDPAPTRKQFGFAMSRDVALCDGMTKLDVSDALDALDEAEEAGQPATKDDLSAIREYHGKLPRKVTQGEAEQIIDALENYNFPCPFCGTEVSAMDDECWSCSKSFRRLKIPIQFGE